MSTLNFNLNLNLNLNSLLVLVLLPVLPRHPCEPHCCLLSAVLLGKKVGGFSKLCVFQIGPWLTWWPSIYLRNYHPEAGHWP